MEYTAGDEELNFSAFDLGKNARERTKFDSFAIQYDINRQGRTYHVGARSISHSGNQTVRDFGVALGITSSHRTGLEVMAEMAAFQGWEDSSDTALFGTVGASYDYGSLTYSGVYSRRRIGHDTADHLLSLGMDWNVDDTTVFSLGLAREFNSVEAVSMIGVSVTKQFEN